MREASPFDFGPGAAFGAGTGPFASAVTAFPISFIFEEMSSGVLASAFGAEASALSPSPSKMAMGWLTFTPSEPSGTRIFPIFPSSMDSNSIVALSVSISARTVPDLTVSPSLTCHFASLPSSIVGESAGMLEHRAKGASAGHYNADG